jgi:hypothetical protein
MLSDVADSADPRALPAAHLLESLLVPSPDIRVSVAPWGALSSAVVGTGRILSPADRGVLKSVFSDPSCVGGFFALCRPPPHSTDSSAYSSVRLCASRALCVAVQLDLLQSSAELHNCLLSLLYAVDPQLQYAALLVAGHLVLGDPAAGRALLANHVYERDSLLMRVFALLTAQPHSRQVGVPTTGERVVPASLWLLAVLLRGTDPSPQLLQTLMRLNLPFVLGVCSERADCTLSLCVILCRVAAQLLPQERSVLFHTELLQFLTSTEQQLTQHDNGAELNPAKHAALFALTNGVYE